MLETGKEAGGTCSGNEGRKFNEGTWGRGSRAPSWGSEKPRPAPAGSRTFSARKGRGRGAEGARKGHGSWILRKAAAVKVAQGDLKRDDRMCDVGSRKLAWTQLIFSVKNELTT